MFSDTFVTYMDDQALHSHICLNVRIEIYLQPVCLPYSILSNKLKVYKKCAGVDGQYIRGCWSQPD